MIYMTRHVTIYSYSEPVQVSHHLAHLTPRIVPHQSCRSSSLTISPEPALIDRGRIDYFGNPATYFTLQDPHRTLRIEAVSEIDVAAPILPDPGDTMAWEDVRAMLADPQEAETREACEYVFESGMIPVGEDLAAYALPSFPPRRPILAGLLDLTRRIHADFTYDQAATTVATPVTQVLREKRGVCQDFAHLQIACLRSLGLAARYVSGYLLTRPPEGQEKLVGSDASHAWLSLFVPGSGWIDADPTNGCLPGIEHITLAWGRDFDDVSPLKGIVLGGGEHALRVEVDVVLQGEPGAAL